MRGATGRAAAVLLFLLPAVAAAGSLKLHVVDVGQGDGIILECPDGKVGMVVDSADLYEDKGGESAVTVWQRYVEARLPKTSTVPLVVATHPHSDHIGGLAWLLARNKVTLLVDSGLTSESGAYKDYAAARDKKSTDGGKVVSYKPIDQVTAPVQLCRKTVKVTLFRAKPPTDTWCRNDPNRCSVIARVEYKKTSFLLMGDAEKSAEARLLGDPEQAKLLDVDVLKVGHHGSHGSSSATFLTAVSPTCAVISSGDWKTSAKNAGVDGYHHPRTVTLDAIDAALPADQTDRADRIRAYNSVISKWVNKTIKDGLSVTAKDGNVVVSSDGAKVTCREPPPAPAPTPATPTPP